MTLEEELGMFTGSTRLFQHWTKEFIYTEGIKYLAEKAKAHWLVDAIASYQPQFKHIPFQVWNLEVQADQQAFLFMEEGDGQPVLVRQHIEYTSFPIDMIRLYVVQKTLMLPSEY